jgi:hypothetical protein
VKPHRTPLIAILAVGLLSGSAVAVATQDDVAAPVIVTGSAVDWRSPSPGERTTEDNVVHIEGVNHAHVWEASDPRPSGEVTYTGNWNQYSTDPETQVESGTYELVHADGRWLGTAPAIVVGGLDTLDSVVLSGDGGDDGLSAYVLIDWQTNGEPTFSGLIFPGDLPAFPELADTE